MGHAMTWHGQEQVVGHLVAVGGDGHLAGRVERADDRSGVELDASLGEGDQQGRRRIWRRWYR